MCYLLGGTVSTKAKYTKLKMKTATSETLTAGAWGLHITSFLVASIPYLQVLSLLLAIGVSILTLRKLVKDSKAKKRGSDEEID
jgi:uncharacterized membrane protein